jgi:hypothetical protein
MTPFCSEISFAMSTSIDNPYLQHLPPHQRGAGPAGGSGSMAAAAKDPLYGFLPRKVTSGQVTKAMVRIFHFIAKKNTDSVVDAANRNTTQTRSRNYHILHNTRRFWRVGRSYLCSPKWKNFTRW